MAQFKRTDAYALISAVMAQLTGETSYSVIDAQGFLDAGKLALSYDTEEIFNAVSIVCGRLFIATRPYKAPLWILDSISSGDFTARFRKISYYSNKPLPSGAYNTDLYTNLAYGFDNGTNPSGGSDQSTGSMWEQHPTYPLEMNFMSSSTWQDCLTRYEHQLKIAFTSEDEWIRFWEGIMTEKANDIEQEKEAHNRLTLLSRMGIAAAMAESTSAIKGACTVIDMTAAFNAYYGTNYTGEALRTTYLKEFTMFFIAKFKEVSNLMTKRSVLFHYAPAKSYGGASHYILRHTPKSEQRFMMFTPLWEKVKATVMPEVFNDEYLSFDTQFESVDFWQNLSTSETDRAGINTYITVPGWLESAITSGVTTTDTKYTFNPDYVLGCLYDRDAVMTDFQFEDAKTTPVEARKHFVNTWYTFAKGAIGDPTENFVLFTMGDNKPADNNSKANEEPKEDVVEEPKTTRKTASK